MPVFSSRSTFIFCWDSTSACVTTIQINGKDGLEIKESNLIWVHHVVDNEAASTGYIQQVEENAQVTFCSTKATSPITWLYILITSGQSSWNLDTNPIWRCGTADVVIISSTFLNSTVTEQSSNHFQ